MNRVEAGVWSWLNTEIIWVNCLKKAASKWTVNDYLAGHLPAAGRWQLESIWHKNSDEFELIIKSIESQLRTPAENIKK